MPVLSKKDKFMERQKNPTPREPDLNVGNICQQQQVTVTHLVADCSVEVEQELLEQDVAALCILSAFIVLQLTVAEIKSSRM